jgi:hypothetical protein
VPGELKYPTFNLRIKNEKGKALVFDEVRKKWTNLSPEEWVRQHVINYLINYKNVPASLISVEKEIILNNTRKRYDLVVYDKTMRAVLLVECKSPDVELKPSTLEQALRYNLILGVKYLLISNGLNDFSVMVENNKGTMLADLPVFDDLR